MLIAALILVIFLVLSLEPLALEKPFNSGDLADMGIRLERL